MRSILHESCSGLRATTSSPRDRCCLVELCKNNALDLPGELDGVDRLSEFGVRVRYGMTEAALDRDQALRWAARAVEWAEGIVEAAQESVESPGEAAEPVDE